MVVKVKRSSTRKTTDYDALYSKEVGVNNKVSLFERLTPVLLAATIILSFGVGVLWQKVSVLEKGGTAAPSGTTGTAPAQPAASVLADLPKLADSLKVDKKKFQSCFDTGKYKDRVESDYQEGIKAGITGTPGSFVLNKKGETWFIPGAFPLTDVKATIDIALGKADAKTLPQQIVKLDATKSAAVPKLKDQDHVSGDRNANVLLVEYSDFQCPFCQRFHPTTLQVLKDYGKDVALVYRHFPLDQLHPYARPAAEASECVKELGGEQAFWKFADKAFGV